MIEAVMFTALVMLGWMFKSQMLPGWIGQIAVSGELIRAVAVFVVAWVAPFALAALMTYVLFRLPLRRRERGRFFLDLIEAGLAQGRSPEHTVVGAAESGDSSCGKSFALVAAQVRSGCRLSQALDRVPQLVPPQVRAMLRVGENLGNLGKVIPACRAVLDQGLTGASGVLHSMPLLFYLILPAPVFLLWFFPVAILPKYRMLMVDMGVSPPYLFRWVFDRSWVLTVVGSVLFGLLAAYFIVYWAGPRLRVWFRSVPDRVIDRIGYGIPWRRTRLQRDFVQMLSLLLDAEVPEERAVRLAAEATANGVVLEQAARAIKDLGQGKSLPEAMRRMDRRGELQWCLANAVHGPRQFTRALASWGETLDARAFQQEQVGLQLFTTGFVLVNALIVGLVVAGVFSFLVQVTEEAALW